MAGSSAGRGTASLPRRLPATAVLGAPRACSAAAAQGTGRSAGGGPARSFAGSRSGPRARPSAQLGSLPGTGGASRGRRRLGPCGSPARSRGGRRFRRATVGGSRSRSGGSFGVRHRFGSLQGLAASAARFGGSVPSVVLAGTLHRPAFAQGRLVGAQGVRCGPRPAGGGCKADVGLGRRLPRLGLSPHYGRLRRSCPRPWRPGFGST